MKSINPPLDVMADTPAVPVAPKTYVQDVRDNAFRETIYMSIAAMSICLVWELIAAQKTIIIYQAENQRNKKQSYCDDLWDEPLVLHVRNAFTFSSV